MTDDIISEMDLGILIDFKTRPRYQSCRNDVEKLAEFMKKHSHELHKFCFTILPDSSYMVSKMQFTVGRIKNATSSECIHTVVLRTAYECSAVKKICSQYGVTIG